MAANEVQVETVSLSKIGIALILAEQDLRNAIAAKRRWDIAQREANEQVQTCNERIAEIQSGIARLKNSI